MGQGMTPHLNPKFAAISRKVAIFHLTSEGGKRPILNIKLFKLTEKVSAKLSGLERFSTSYNFMYNSF